MFPLFCSEVEFREAREEFSNSREVTRHMRSRTDPVNEGDDVESPRGEIIHDLDLS